MVSRLLRLGLLVALVAHLGACQRGDPSGGDSEQVLASYPVRDLAGVVARDRVSLDTQTSTDGNGSLRIEATRPTTVELWVARDTAVEDAMLYYRARLRSQGLEGRAYLEMWAHFPGQGEYFSRGLHSAISGDTDWSVQETPFRLERGQKPDFVKLNLVLEGAGTVWIDDASLVAAPLG